MNTYVAKLDATYFVPADDNPQSMSSAMFQALKNTIAEDGDMLDTPAVWKDGDRFRIISGHHRVKACLELGQPLIDVKVFDDPACNELWYRRRVLSANKTHGKPEDEALRAFIATTFEMHDIAREDFFRDLGFNASEINAYTAKVDPMDLSRDDSEITVDDTAGGGEVAVDPKTVKQVNIFFAVADYPPFMRVASELMEIWKLSSLSEVVRFAVDRAHKEVTGAHPRTSA